MQNLLNELTTLLEKEDKYISEGKLLKNVIIEDALKLEPSFLILLLKNKRIKKNFFQEIEGIFVFDKIKFQKFISNKEFLPDSYTAFKNKIGLTKDGEFITENKDVVLCWPYKDCVLEGGQDKEDAKRDEIFWNETLAPDEVDRLLSPKVLTNWKKFDKDGEHIVEEVSEIDNLIIKGNNLLGLSSILKKYRGKIKLIYIDPPYNLSNDSFTYNDTFNHSTWLTFMKSRLELANILLDPKGSIWINIDDTEAHYLKVLSDSIFSRENFVANIVWEKTYTPKSNGRAISTDHDHILIYAKNKSTWLTSEWNYIPRNEEQSGRFSNPDNDPRGPWRTYPLDVRTENDARREKYRYEVTTPSGRKVKPAKGRHWSLPETEFKKMNDDGQIYYGINGDAIPTIKKYLSEARDGVIARSWWKNSDITDSTTDELIEHLYSLWPYREVTGNQDAKRELLSLFDNPGFITPKPEKLIQRILTIGSKENDIVLDFFAGSGTTASVALKMKRRFITIEQLDYIEALTVTRLKKVISGEQGGISKDENWQGGGSFIFCELVKANQKYIDMINEAKDTTSLLRIWKTIQKKAFISYKVDIKAINENVSDFEKLPIEKQKRFLIETLDKNMLYVPYSEIDDTDYNISDEDKKLNHKFYGGKA